MSGRNASGEQFLAVVPVDRGPFDVHAVVAQRVYAGRHGVHRGNAADDAIAAGHGADE